MLRIARQPADGARTRARPAVLIGACLLVAAVSLVLPATLAFDAWAWLVWGRELIHLDLDTTGGPSWKPLPVLVTTPLAATGGAAPALWLLVARAASLLGLAGTYRLGARFAGRWAGAIAVAALVVMPYGGTRFWRLLLEGHSATIGVTLTVWAVDRHRDGARAHALLLLTGLALARPEAWPFVALYALWCWRREVRHRPLVLVVLAAIPVLWFGGDWLGSGSPLHGADAAQVVAGSAGERLVEALGRALDVVSVPIWAAAVIGLVLEHRRPGSVGPALAVAAAAWMAIVVVMSGLLGYAALVRFFLPAVALVCVLAGIGVVRALALLPHGRGRLVAAAVLVAATVPGLVSPVRDLDRLADASRGRARLDEGLDAAITDAGGRDAVLACGAVAIDQTGLAGPLLPGLAWKLDVPLARVRRGLGDRPGVLFARAHDGADDPSAGGRAAEVLGRSREWVVLVVGCPTVGD